MADPIDIDNLPPTQYLVMEVLAARARTGESLWTFPSNLAVPLRSLEQLGLVSVMHGVAPASLRARLTETGKSCVLKPDFVPPVVQQVLDAVEEGMRAASDLLAKIGTPQAIDHGLGVAYAIPKVKAYVRGALGVRATETNPSSGESGE